MLKLIQRLLIIALALFILMFVYLNVAEACGNWVLEYSDRVGGRSGKMVNYCYYQDLSGSGQALSVQMPAYKECPVILDPCPEGGSDTTVTINQPTPEKTYVPPAPPVKSKIDTSWEDTPPKDEYDRFVDSNLPWEEFKKVEAEREANLKRQWQEDYNEFNWTEDYEKLQNGTMSTKEFNDKWIGYGVYKPTGNLVLSHLSEEELIQIAIQWLDEGKYKTSAEVVSAMRKQLILESKGVYK